jgi:hypothetical protein
MHAVQSVFPSIYGRYECSWHRLNDRLPQESLFAPVLFNLYLSDISETLSKQFQYADDIALTYQANSFLECETNLEADIERLKTPVRLDVGHST